ncbi:hypothetical protein T492DRAFT_281391 [Pavlovales sp. CCMP2436]|nr:hypothetical protein T492DRAFT_281391 [Pavlovales sp. CCMP2436]
MHERVLGHLQYVLQVCYLFGLTILAAGAFTRAEVRRRSAVGPAAGALAVFRCAGAHCPGLIAGFGLRGSCAAFGPMRGPGCVAAVGGRGLRVLPWEGRGAPNRPAASAAISSLPVNAGDEIYNSGSALFSRPGTESFMPTHNRENDGRGHSRDYIRIHMLIKNRKNAS